MEYVEVFNSGRWTRYVRVRQVIERFRFEPYSSFLILLLYVSAWPTRSRPVPKGRVGRLADRRLFFTALSHYIALELCQDQPISRQAVIFDSFDTKICFCWWYWTDEAHQKSSSDIELQIKIRDDTFIFSVSTLRRFKYVFRCDSDDNKIYAITTFGEQRLYVCTA